MHGPRWITDDLWGDSPEDAESNRTRYFQFVVATMLFAVAGAVLLVAGGLGWGNLSHLTGWTRFVPAVILFLIALVCGMRLKVFVDDARARQTRRSRTGT